MIKGVHACGEFRKVGDVIDATDEQADELIRIQVAEASDSKPAKKTSKKSE